MATRSRGGAWLPWLVILGVTAAGLVLLVTRPAGPGPLPMTDAISGNTRFETGHITTWGMILGPNKTDQALTLDDVEPISVEGVKVLGFLVTQVGGDELSGSFGNVRGWPPPPELLFNGQPPKGVLIPPADGSPYILQLCIGLQALDQPGQVRGFRIRYHVGFTQYTLDQPWTFGFKMMPADSPPATSAP